MRPSTLPLAALACLALCSTAAAASGDDAPPVRFSGFGTLGGLHTQGDGAGFIRDLAQPHGSDNRGISWHQDTRLGIQASYKPIEDLEAVAQVVSRYRWDNNFTPEMTWGFLKYAATDNADLRVGRIGFDAFLSSDSRDVGYAYLWVRPPVEYYGPVLFPYLDGLDFVLRWPVGSGTGRVKAYSGIARQIVPTAGMLEDLSGSRVTGGFLDYQDTHWTARVGLADLRVLHEIPGTPFDILGAIRNTADMQSDASVAHDFRTLAADTSLAGKHVRFKSIALAYEDGPLQTQIGLSEFTPHSLVFPRSFAGYLSVGYRYGKITPYAAIASARSRKIHRADELAGRGINTAPALSIMNYMFTSGERNQHTYTLGLRNDITEKLALKLQIDVIRSRTCSPLSLPIIGTSPPCGSPLLWPNVPAHWNGRANVYSATLDFIF